MKFKRRIAILIALAAIGAAAHILIGRFSNNIIQTSSVQVVKILSLSATAVLTAAAIYGIYILALYGISVRKRMNANKRIRTEIAGFQSDPLKNIIREINEYLHESKSTAFFEEKLNTIAVQLPQIAEQIENLKIIAKKRFGSSDVSYSSNVQPVETLFSNLIKLSGDLIMKLQMFDEDKYQSKISELKAAKRLKDAAEYEEVLQHYANYAGEIVDALEKTSMKMDKFILEFAKLNGDELRRSIESLRALDSAIVNTKLYS